LTAEDYGVARGVGWEGGGGERSEGEESEQNMYLAHGNETYSGATIIYLPLVEPDKKIGVDLPN
jgi:hypothetical protein